MKKIKLFFILIIFLLIYNFINSLVIQNTKIVTPSYEETIIDSPIGGFEMKILKRDMKGPQYDTIKINGIKFILIKTVYNKNINTIKEL